MADWGDAPAVLVFGDTEDGRDAAEASVARSGGRIAAAMPLDQAIDRLDSQVAVDLVVLDVADDHGPMLDQLLRRIEDGAAAREFGAIVIVPPELVDAAAARIVHENVELLVGREPRAVAAALAGALDRSSPQLREPSGDGDAARLQYLTEAMERHGEALSASIEAGMGGVERLAAEAAGRAGDTFDLTEAATIRSIIRARRLRAQYFGGGLFADPAWDILLDLTAARLEGRSVAVSSLCIAAAVPATTALRWIKQLTEAGLLKRVADPVDGRRVFIELTDYAARTMTAYFEAVARGARG